MPLVVSIFSFVALAVWIFPIGILYWHGQREAAIVASVRWVTSVIFNTCIFSGDDRLCLFTDGQRLTLANNMETTWAAIGIQLMTNSLEEKHRWVQFMVLMFAGLLSAVFIDTHDGPWIPIIQMGLIMFVVPLNWRLTSQAVPYTNPKFYGPIVVCGLGLLCFFIMYEWNIYAALIIWQLSFILSTVLTHISKIHWATRNSTPDVSAPNTPHTGGRRSSIIRTPSSSVDGSSDGSSEDYFFHD